MTLVKTLYRSFRTRLFLALALIIFLFISGTGFFSYLEARKAVEKQVQHYAISTASQISERIRQFLWQHKHTVSLIKSFVEQDMIQTDNRQKLLEFFYILKRDHPAFVNVYYGDQNGNFIMAPPQRPEIHKIFDPRSRPWYKGAVAARGVHWTNVYLFASTQSPGITASAPIYNSDGYLFGVCGIDIDLSTFSKFLQGIEIENQGYAYIIENQRSRVIAHPGLVRQTWDPVHVQLLSACLTDLKALGKQFGLTAFQGGYFFTAYVDYPENDWTVGVTLPMTEFLKHVKKIKSTTVSMVVVGMVLAAVLSYLLSLAIVHPLQALRQGIERIRQGDLDHFVHPANLDITDALSHDFNQMAASLKDSREVLKRTYIELVEKEKMAALGQMTAGIAHELKNPLGVILGSAQVVANRQRPLDMREKAARFIIDEIESLDKTLKAFLAFSRPASPVFKPTDVVQLLDDVLASTESQMSDAGIRILKKIDVGDSLCLADKDQIRQVFWNILLNAVQALPEGGCITIDTKLELLQKPNDPWSSSNYAYDDKALVVTISDNGNGIAEEHLDTVFDPFVSYREDGIGLGLSIVHQILKLHRAGISVVSSKNQGTTITLTFPRKKSRSHHESKNPSC